MNHAQDKRIAFHIQRGISVKRVVLQRANNCMFERRSPDNYIQVDQSKGMSRWHKFAAALYVHTCVGVTAGSLYSLQGRGLHNSLHSALYTHTAKHKHSALGWHQKTMQATRPHALICASAYI